MSIQEIIDNHIRKFLGVSSDWEIGAIQKTRKEFTGDFSINVFPIYRSLKTLGKKYAEMSIDQFTNDLSGYLKADVQEIESINTVKGFINILLKDSYWIKFFSSIQEDKFGIIKPNENSETVMVEFSSPNTNKPLHLGHVRNNLLGISISEILKAAGKNVIRVNLVNDRGIHICKSMLAWKKWGNGETPENTINPKHRKGDHLVGFYYVRFEFEFRAELMGLLLNARLNNNYSIFGSDSNALEQLDNKRYEIDAIRRKELDSFDAKSYEKFGEEILEIVKMFKEARTNCDSFISSILNAKKYDEQIIKAFEEKASADCKKLVSLEDNIGKIDLERNEIAKKSSTWLREAQEMLLKWEAGDKETIDLWKKMNGWVYDGFAKTYKELGVEFEKTYYESQTYLLGKEFVQHGLKKGVFFKKDDGSVWIDLTADGLDQKLVLRSDGTSVYITQDIGTISHRSMEYKFDRHIYVVGNEQDYHFKVLFLILKKLGYEWADKLFHLSYGMVDLPSGKMKSREGTVVDADELMDEMVNTARETTKALGKTEGMTEAEAETLYHTIGLGALKYFILKVDPKKRMLFDPKESIDFNGNTGPFIQYTYARIKSVLRKAEESSKSQASSSKPQVELHKKEKEVIKLLHGFQAAIQEAADSYNPGHIANYVYDLAKEYNQFYHEVPILKSEKEDEKNFRLTLSEKTAEVIKTSLRLLGINVSERM